MSVGGQRGGEAAPGERIYGNYAVRSLIGEGGMGSVFVAEHRLLKRKVAIKVLRSEYANRPETAERFFREAQATVSVKHPGIVQLLDFGRSDAGELYLVMELLEGRSLTHRLEKGRLPEPEVLDLGAQIADAVAAAHGAGVIHRDLKPDNVFLLEGDRVKLLDFGIAKVAAGEVDRFSTKAGEVFGTPAYMSPEQARGTGQVTPATDVYSLGLLLFEMISGRLPFEGATAWEIVAATVREPPPRPSQFAPLSPDLEGLILSCLEKDPKVRPTMAEARDRLAALLGQATTGISVVAKRSRTTLRPPAETFQRTLPGVMVTGGPTPAWRNPTGGGPPAAPDPTAPPPATTAPPAAPPPVTRGDTPSLVEMAIDALHAQAAEARAATKQLPEPTVPAAGSSDSVDDAAAIGSRSEATEAPAGEPGSDGSWSTLIDDLPPTLAFEREPLGAFLRHLFAAAVRLGPRTFRLDGPAFPAHQGLSFFAIFVADPHSGGGAGAGALGATLFTDQAAALEEHLDLVGARGEKVVLVVTEFTELGAGVRHRIFTYREKWNARIVPLHVGEVRAAVARDDSFGLFVERLRDFHETADPYAGSATARADFFGMRGALNAAVSALGEPQKVLAIHGPPGAGKTTLVQMAEYGHDRRFVRVRCAGIPDRTVDGLVKEVRAALLAAGTSQGATIAPPDSADVRQTLFFAASDPTASPPVLVLEDADWVIALLASREDEAERKKARSFWITITEWTRLQRVRTVITSVRGFLLAERRIDGWENPLCTHLRTVEVPPLDADALRRFVTEVGLQANLAWQPDAVEEVRRLSAGYVHVVKRLCSRVCTAKRQAGAHDPLAPIPVELADVSAAAADLASIGGTFRDSAISWLDDDERRVLREVAHRRPRSPRVLRGALDGELAVERVHDALERLRRLGLVARHLRRDRVSPPLLEAWVRQNFAAPDESWRAQRRRFTWLALGVVVTVVLVLANLSWRSSRVGREAARFQDCGYEVLFPQGGAPETKVQLEVQVRCPAGKTSPKVALRTDLGTEVVDGNGQPFDQLDALDCASGCKDRMHSVVLKAPGPDGRYGFRLEAAGAPFLRFAVRYDTLGAAKNLLAGALNAAQTLPLVLGAAAAFYQDFYAAFRRLGTSLGLLRRRRDDEDPPKPASPPAA